VGPGGAAESEDFAEADVPGRKAESGGSDADSVRSGFCLSPALPPRWGSAIRAVETRADARAYLLSRLRRWGRSCPG